MLKIKHIKRTKADKEFFKKKLAHLGLTFCSKLIIKLTSKVLIPDLDLYILKYEYVNRTNEDIEKILPKIMNLLPLNEYLKYPENKKSSSYFEITKEIAKISFHQKKKKFEIIKRAYEDINKFYYVINGSLCKLILTFKKEKISIEEYLVYMIKMKLLQENQILNKCNELNNSYINIDINNFQNFFEENKEYNYNQLKTKAKNELNSQGVKFIKNKIQIDSIEKYINTSLFRSKDKNNTDTRFNLYIGQYIKIKPLEKGEFIGDLSLNENNEGNTYIAEKKSDIAYIDKIQTMNSVLYKNIFEKYKKIFINKIPKFFIFKDLIKNSNFNFEKNVFPYLIYKHYKKGENIIIQNSQYEGVYFILDGKIKITINKTFNELSNTLISLQYSIFNFKDYVSKIIKTVDILNEFHLKYMLNKQKRKNSVMNLGENKIHVDILSSTEYLDFLKGIKKIEFYEMGIGDVVGLNELYDYKTELFNFSATCISDETHLFFLSKKNFNHIIGKESSIMNNAIKLIDLKANMLMGKINNFRMNYSKEVLNWIKNKKNSGNKNSSKSSIIKNENSKNDKSFFSTINRFNYRKLKEKKIKIKNPNDVSLFKNNELLMYLRNSELERDNSLSDNFDINIGKDSNSRNNKKIKYLSPQCSKNNNFMSFSINQEKNIKHNFSQLNVINNISNINIRNPNSIIYKRNINHLGDGGHLLDNVFENQKRFDAFNKENFYKSENNKNISINNELLPILKNQKNKKKDNIKKKFGKTMSFKFLNPISSNFFEN